MPKSHHVGLDTLSFAVYDAIAHFNDGAISALHILSDVNMDAGVHMMKGLQVQNFLRRKHSAYRMSESQQKRRTIIRHNRKKKQDVNLEKEGPTYEAGGFEETLNIVDVYYCIILTLLFFVDFWCFSLCACAGRLITF